MQLLVHRLIPRLYQVTRELGLNSTDMKTYAAVACDAFAMVESETRNPDWVKVPIRESRRHLSVGVVLRVCGSRGLGESNNVALANHQQLRIRSHLRFGGVPPVNHSWSYIITGSSFPWWTIQEKNIHNTFSLIDRIHSSLTEFIWQVSWRNDSRLQNIQGN